MKKILLLFIPILLFSCCRNFERAEQLYQEALTEYRNKDFEKVLVLTDKAIKENSNLSEAIFLNGKANFFSKNFSSAEKIFRKLCVKHTENFDYKLWLLRTYYFSGNLTSAQEMVIKLIKENSEDWRLYYWKSLISKSQNDFEQYFESLNSADQILKESSYIYQELALIWMELGLADRYSKYIEKVEALKK